MLSYGFDPGAAQYGVTALPAEDLVREQVQIFVNPEAAAREHLVDSHAVGLVRVACHEMLSHSRGEPSRRRPVVGSNDAVADERTIEGDDGVAATGQCVIAEANAVQHGPRRKWEDRRNEKGARPRHALPQAVADSEREERKGNEESIPRTDECEQRDAESGEGESSSGGPPGGSGHEQCPQCEGRREERLARKLV